MGHVNVYGESYEEVRNKILVFSVVTAFTAFYYCLPDKVYPDIGRNGDLSIDTNIYRYFDDVLKMKKEVRVSVFLCTPALSKNLYRHSMWHLDY